MQDRARGTFYRLRLVFGALCLTGAVLAQTAPPPQDAPLRQPARATLSPEELETLVSPIALYPDPLLSQVLAASTYPLELVMAGQWLDQHRNLQGAQSVDAAKQMNWDASVQAMVAFPDVLRKLTENVSWTTDLGNAFLAQQSDVMDAIQRLRGRARQNGRLDSTPEQVVTSELGQDRNAVAIQPADPRMLYVPAYNPYYVWGPPPVGLYPSLAYPSADAGIGFGAATAIASIFAGLAGWSGWGWGVNWLTHGLLLNGLFFNHFGLGGSGGGFGGGYGGGYGGYNGGAYNAAYGATTAWVHNPAHRLGIPYANNAVASRFGRTTRAAAPVGSRGGRQNFGGRPAPAAVSPGGSAGWRTFAPRSSGPAYQSYQHQAYRPGPSSYRAYSGTPGYSNRVPRSYSPGGSQQHYARSYAEPKWSGGGGHYSASKAPKMPKFKAPKYSAPKFSSHSSKGHSGGHSGGKSKGHHH